MDPTGDPPIRIDWFVQMVDMFYIVVDIITNILTSEVPTFFDSVVGMFLDLFGQGTGG